MSESELIYKIVDGLAKQLRPAIPLSIDLWDIATIAQYLKRDNAVVRERIVSLTDFPKAIRLPSNKGRAHPLYKASQVIEWAEKHQDARSNK